MARSWQGNISLELGTGFWIFLTVLVLGFIVWRMIGKDKLAGMLSYSLIGTGDRSLVASKN